MWLKTVVSLKCQEVILFSAYCCVLTGYEESRSKNCSFYLSIRSLTGKHLGVCDPFRSRGLLCPLGLPLEVACERKVSQWYHVQIHAPMHWEVHEGYGFLLESREQANVM